MPIHRVLALSCTLWLAATVMGQEPQAEESPQEQESIIRVVTELVELRVVVTDKHGQPVTDLGREDFVLLEDDQVQEISFFEAVEIPTTAGSVRLGGRVPARPVGSLDDPGPISRDPPQRTVMLFVDTLHMTPSSLHRVKKSLHDFLEEQMTGQDLAAVVSTRRGLGVTGQFSRNPHVLRYAIDKLSPGQPVNPSAFTPYLAAQIERGDRQALQLGMQILATEDGLPSASAPSTMSSFEGGVVGQAGDDPLGGDAVSAMARSRAVQVLSEASFYRTATLSTLKTAADRMASLPGQRLLVLYSDGFSLMDRFGTVDPVELRETINRAVSSGVIIYSVDAKGLQPPPLFNASTRGVYDPGMFSYMTSAEKDAEDSLNALAKDTGGETFFNTNDLTGAMAQALDNNRFYYRLGYYPKDEDRENYGRFTVRVEERPDYRIRTQRGYSPTEFFRADNREGERTPEEAFQEAVLSPLPVTDIGMMVRSQYLETELDDAQVSIHTHIEGDRLPLHDEGLGRDDLLLSLELLTYVIDEKGKSVDGKSQLIRMSMRPEAVDEFRERGLHLTRRLKLKPGLYQIRAGVRDRATERTGTAASWIEVPRVSRKNLALSSIILLDWKQLEPASPEPLQETADGEVAQSSSDSPPESAQGDEGTGEDEGASQDEAVRGEWTNSELKEGFRFYRAGDAFTYFLIVYHGDKAGPESDLLIKSDFLFNGEAVVPGSWQPLSERRLGEEKGGTMVGGQISLTQTPPGIYEFVVTVRKANSKKSTQRSVTFGISG